MVWKDREAAPLSVRGHDDVCLFPLGSNFSPWEIGLKIPTNIGCVLKNRRLWNYFFDYNDFATSAWQSVSQNSKDATCSKVVVLNLSKLHVSSIRLASGLCHWEEASFWLAGGICSPDAKNQVLQLFRPSPRVMNYEVSLRAGFVLESKAGFQQVF